MTLSLCFLAMASIASTSQGNPYTCVASIADVFGVIAASIFSESMVKVSGLMSTKTGDAFSQTMEEVVATYEKGVVMISPFKSSALMAICIAMVPLLIKKKCFTPRYSL